MASRYALLVISGMGFGFLGAREIRTPLPIYYTPYHYPLQWKDRKGEDWCWNVDVTGAAFSRSTNEGFASCDSRCHVPYSTLVFGKSDFTIADSFPDGSIGTVGLSNPLAAVFEITSRYTYTELGAMFGIQVGTSFCEGKYHTGFRAKLPYRDISVNEVCAEDLVNTNSGVIDSLYDVYRTRVQSAPPDTPTVVAAVRLDFLTQLNSIDYDGTGSRVPLVLYSDPNNSGHISIAGQDATNAPSLDDSEGVPLVEVIYTANGKVPTALRWAELPSAGNNALAADGAGFANNERGYFDQNVDYTPLGASTANQSHLFVVASLQGDSGSSEVDPTAEQVFNAIQAAVDNFDFDTSINDFLAENGINFCDRRTKGIGDLLLEWYINGLWCDDTLLAEFKFAVRAPTGDKLCSCLTPLKQPTGNNGHTEIWLGGVLGYEICSKVMAHFDGYYAFALSHCESVAAPFTGATIKNLGPCVNADISWQYFQGNFALTFLADECTGFAVGYQPYWKKCDKVCLNQSTATDLAGTPDQPLDASNLQALTRVVAQRVSAEFFMRTALCDITAGWGTIVAGSNATRDTDWYLMFKISF